jgi:hypothetical protein
MIRRMLGMIRGAYLLVFLARREGC